MVYLVRVAGDVSRTTRDASTPDWPHCTCGSMHRTNYLDRLQKFFQMRGGFATDEAGVANPQQFLLADDLKLRIISPRIRQSEIAAELGVKQSYISQLLNGWRPWPAEHRARVEQMLTDIESDQACVEADPEAGVAYKGRNFGMRYKQNDGILGAGISRMTELRPSVKNQNVHISREIAGFRSGKPPH